MSPLLIALLLLREFHSVNQLTECLLEARPFVGAWGYRDNVKQGCQSSG